MDAPSWESNPFGHILYMQTMDMYSNVSVSPLAIVPEYGNRRKMFFPCAWKNQSIKVAPYYQKLVFGFNVFWDRGGIITMGFGG